MENIALQLWTVREQYDSDPARVLHRVAENGYPAIELVYGRTGGLTPAHQKEICDDVGLRVPAVHCFFNEIEDQLDGLIEAGKELGVERTSCARGWIPASGQCGQLPVSGRSAGHRRDPHARRRAAARLPSPRLRVSRRGR